MSNSKLGLWSVVFLGINCIIGSGIFLLPSYIYNMVGNMSLVILGMGAILAFLLALCYAEAASWVHDENGSSFIYAKKAFGEFVGFEAGIMSYVVWLIAWGGVSSAFVTALGYVLPILREEPYNLIASAAFVLFMSVINALGLKSTKFTNNLITVCKLIPMGLFILVGFFFLNGDNLVSQPIELPEQNSQTWSTALMVAFYSFIGFGAVSTAVLDMNNPRRDVPRAMLIILAIVTLVYGFIVTICTGILGLELSNTNTPVAESANRMVNGGGIFITIVTLISISGINLAYSYLAPKSGEALGQNGFLPKFMTRTDSQGTPIVSIIVTTALVMIITLMEGFEALVKITVVANLLNYVPTCLSVLVFRKRNPDNPAPFIIPGGPIVPVLASLSCVWLLTFASMSELIWGAGALLIGVPFYLVRKSREQQA